MKKLLSGLAHSYVLAVVILSVSSSLFAAAVAETKNDGAVAIMTPMPTSSEAIVEEALFRQARRRLARWTAIESKWRFCYLRRFLPITGYLWSSKP